ncbi:MAG: RDD family protein [Anaerolineae bacterium]
MMALDSQRRMPVAFEQATSYRRLCARLIDLVIVGILFSVVMFALALVASGIEVGAKAAGYLALVAGAGVSIAYDTALICLTGKTLGMRMLGMRVINAQGEHIGLGWCLLRTIVLYLLLAGFIFLIVATASIIGWILIIGLRKFTKFPQDAASRSYTVREIKGQLSSAQSLEITTTNNQPATPFADLEALRTDGIISEEEYLRKRKELGL